MNVVCKEKLVRLVLVNTSRGIKVSANLLRLYKIVKDILNLV